MTIPSITDLFKPLPAGQVQGEQGGALTSNEASSDDVWRYLDLVGAAIALLGLAWYQVKKGLWRQHLKIIGDLTKRIDKICGYIESEEREKFYNDKNLADLFKLLYQATASLQYQKLANAYGNTPWHINNLDGEIDRLIGMRCKGYAPVTKEEFDTAKKRVNPDALWRSAKEPLPYDPPLEKTFWDEAIIPIAVLLGWAGGKLVVGAELAAEGGATLLGLADKAWVAASSIFFIFPKRLLDWFLESDDSQT